MASIAELKAAIDKARAPVEDAEPENTESVEDPKFAEMQATIEALKDENKTLVDAVGGSFATLEEELKARLSEMEKKQDNPTTKQVAAAKTFSVKDAKAEDATFFMWRIAVEQRDKQNPGYADRQYKKVEIREREAGLLEV